MSNVRRQIALVPELNTLSLLLSALAAMLLAWLVYGWLAVGRRATAVDPNSSAWLIAVQKAQGSLSTAWVLHEQEPGSVSVKFSVKTKIGTREHAWGQLLSFDAASFTVSLDSEMIESAAESPSPYTLPHNALEDWVMFVPDGTIRGAFTVQAEIALAHAEGKRPSKQAQAMQGHFVDV